MHKVVMIRHGESLWNKENRFSGWKDIALSEKGREEARQAGKTLLQENFVFDYAFSSYLKRAIHTLDIVLDTMDLLWIPVVKSWRLNERHYGALQGLNKAETAQKHGEEQVQIWRRSYDIKPPELSKLDEHYPGNDPKYAGLKENDLPLSECLKDTVERFLPFWHKSIAAAIQSGKKVIIAAHGNSLRAAVQYLDNLSREEVLALNIPTGIPLVYELDDNLQAQRHYYLGDEKAVQAAINTVLGQGKTGA